MNNLLGNTIIKTLIVIFMLLTQFFHNSFAEQDLSEGIGDFNKIARDNDGETLYDYAKMHKDTLRRYFENSSSISSQPNNNKKSLLSAPNASVTKKYVPCFTVEKNEPSHKLIHCENNDYKVIKLASNSDYWIIEEGFSFPGLKGKWRTFDEATSIACKCK
ncbi:MAG: hypothetical protein NTV43_15015 [Methylococcales bacterium]|nr:hypothetical protein [Methylococcales bacterium]